MWPLLILVNEILRVQWQIWGPLHILYLTEKNDFLFEVFVQEKYILVVF